MSRDHYGIVAETISCLPKSPLSCFIVTGNIMNQLYYIFSASLAIGCDHVLKFPPKLGEKYYNCLVKLLKYSVLCSFPFHVGILGLGVWMTKWSSVEPSHWHIHMSCWVRKLSHRLQTLGCIRNTWKVCLNTDLWPSVSEFLIQ